MEIVWTHRAGHRIVDLSIREMIGLVEIYEPRRRGPTLRETKRRSAGDPYKDSG